MRPSSSYFIISGGFLHCSSLGFLILLYSDFSHGNHALFCSCWFGGRPVAQRAGLGSRCGCCSSSCNRWGSEAESRARGTQGNQLASGAPSPTLPYSSKPPPASGPLHWPVPLPGHFCCPQVSPRLASSFLPALVEMSVLRGGLSEAPLTS